MARHGSSALLLAAWLAGLSCSARSRPAGGADDIAGPTVPAASCAQADVEAAVAAARGGETVLVPPGRCTWAGPVRLPNDRGVSLACRPAGSCLVTAEGTAVLLEITGDNPHLYRISGFTFGNTGASFVVWIDGSGSLRRFRIDHNTFSGLAEGSVAVFLGDTQAIASYAGVVDHNLLANPVTATLFHWIGRENPTPPPSPQGTDDNVFLEDNVVDIASMTNPGAGCTDSWGGAQVVFRHNTTRNCLAASHGVVHAGGPQSWELYGNHFRVDAGADPNFQDCYRCFHHQGSGGLLAFDNLFTAFSGKSGDPLEVTHYRSATPGPPDNAGYGDPPGRCDGTNPLDGNRAPRSTYLGYPCWRQPGRDFAGNLVPMYAWNNRWSDTGARIDLLVADPWGASSPSVLDHIVADRDLYNAVSASAQASPAGPFDGTTGMGFGTLANRPATCATNPAEAGGGVGYWATDTQTLYRCAATDTWVAHYRPYPYPHPLAQ